MTRLEKLRTWNVMQLAGFMMSIERFASRESEKYAGWSNEELMKDWIDFFNGEYVEEKE